MKTATETWATARGMEEGAYLHAIGGHDWPENAVDRSNLLAAAPALLAACKALLADLPSVSSFAAQFPNAAVRVARAAIAQAEGRAE